MTRRAFVVGAGGAVGEAAVLALRQAGWRVVASMRTRRDDVAARLHAAGAEVAFHTLGASDWAADAAGADALIFVANLNLTRAALEAAPSAARIVAFSSNNVAADADAATYQALAANEAALRARFANVAIIRPTLIYGDPRLVTVTRLLRWAQTLPMLPLPGSGRARVQPVFCADLGRAAAGLAAPDAPAGVFAVGGPDIVSMRQFYAQIAATVGRTPAIIPVPRFALHAASLFGVLSAEQVARAEHDRTAIVQDALPAELAPRTSLQDGLAQHFSAMGGSPAGARS